MVDQTETKQEEQAKTESQLLDELKSQYSKADTAHQEIRNGYFSWDDREDLFFGRYKAQGEETKSILSTGELTTLAIDGSCRVMAQLPTGRFYNYNGEPGSNILMNLLFEHYVVPNATTGGNLLMKHRMVNMYSRVFPAVPVFIDWVVNEGKYIGPDLVVIHPRRFRPQPGKVAVEDMDYCFVDTEVSKEWLESKKKTGVWKNVDEVVKQFGEGQGASDQNRSPKEKGKTKTGITITHRFKSNGDWTIWAGDYILVDEKGYFPCIPISVKLQYPSMDSFWGFSDFDRGEMTQKSIDSLIRMYLDGVSMSIDPPAIMDPEKVVMSSIVRQAKAKWFVKNGEMGAIRMEDVSPKGLATFQSTYSILKANLLSLGASTDTAVSKNVDPGFGKTPEAIREQSDRQGARDAWDAFMTEQYICRTYTIMADMLAKLGVKEYAFQLLGNSIKKIKEQYPKEKALDQLGKQFESGKATVDPKFVSGKWRFEIDPGSTAVKRDDTGAKMLSFIDVYNKYPGIKEDFVQSNTKFNQGEAFKRAFIDSGVQDSDKIIVTEENPQSMEGVGAQGATVQPQTIPQQVPQEVVQANPEIMTQ